MGTTSLLLLGLIALVIMFVVNPVQAFKGVVGAGIAGIVLVPFLGPVGVILCIVLFFGLYFMA
jgi:hypothetical protein